MPRIAPSPFFTVQDGSLEVQCGEFSGKFSPAEAGLLVDLFGRMIAAGWDGDGECSSSCDFADEYGWPEDQVRTFIGKAFNAAQESAA
jgi:hypothetical protein